MSIEHRHQHQNVQGKIRSWKGVIRSRNPVEAALETNRKAGTLWKGQLVLDEKYQPMILCAQRKYQQNSEEVWLNPQERAESQAGEEARSAINYGYYVQTDQAIHSHTNETIRSSSSSRKDLPLPEQSDRKEEEIEELKKQYLSQSAYTAHRSQAKSSTFSCKFHTETGALQTVH